MTKAQTEALAKGDRIVLNTIRGGTRGGTVDERGVTGFYVDWDVGTRGFVRFADNPRLEREPAST